MEICSSTGSAVQTPERLIVAIDARKWGVELHLLASCRVACTACKCQIGTYLSSILLQFSCTHLFFVQVLVCVIIQGS
jgi:hypothetical protein